MAFPKVEPHLSETYGARFRARAKFNLFLGCLRTLENCYKIKVTLDALGRRGTVFERKATGLRRSRQKIVIFTVIFERTNFKQNSISNS